LGKKRVRKEGRGKDQREGGGVGSAQKERVVALKGKGRTTSTGRLSSIQRGDGGGKF